MLDDAIPIEPSDAPQLVAYPRPKTRRVLSERLTLLARAYFGLSVPFMTAFLIAAVFVAVDGLSNVGFLIRLPSAFDTVSIVWLLSLPILGACLSYFRLRNLALGSEWLPWTGIALTVLIPVYMFAVGFFWPGEPTDQQPIVYFINDSSVFAVALLIFPAIRLLAAVQLCRAGLRARFLFLGQKRVRKEIERIESLESSLTAMPLAHEGDGLYARVDGTP